MALSSGASGTTGFALGTAGGEEEKNSQSVSQSVASETACPELRRLGEDYVLSSFDTSLWQREGYLCMCRWCLPDESAERRRRRRRKDELEETRPASLSCRKN